MGDFDMFDQQEASDRRARIERARADHEAYELAQADAAARRKVEADALSARANETLRLHEYFAAGVEPPIIDGVRTKTSLPLLRKMGWTVRDTGLGNLDLVAPANIPAVRRKTREDYEQST